MKLFRDEQDHNARTEAWKERIANKETMSFPDEIMYEIGDLNEPKRASFKGAYNRFVDYTKVWLFGMMKGVPSITDYLPDGENAKFQYDFEKNFNEKQVWGLLSKAGKGGDLPKGLSSDPKYGKNENTRATVYDQLMPAYRATRESFKSRPWYHWITDHANYTAERDAMHAIRGAIRALTGDTKEDVDNAYTEYQAQIIEGLAAKDEEAESVLEKIEVEKENVSQIKKDLDKNEEKKLDDVINENEEPIKEHEQINQSLNRVLVNDNSEPVNNENNEQEQMNVNEEAQRLAELEAQRKAEEEAKRKAEEEEAQRKAEEEAKRKAEEEEAQRKAEEEAKRKAEEEEAQRKAEEAAKKQAEEEEAKRKAEEEEAQRKAGDEEAKKQAEAEDNAKKLEEIKNTVEQIEVTDENFKSLCEASKENEELKAKVIAEFKETLGAVYKGNYINDYANSCHYTATTVSELFLGGFNTDVTGMRDFVFNVFDGVFTNIDSLDLDADQKILTTQKITNIIVRNFPPVCHQIDKLSVYADNYIINGKTIYSQDKLKEILKDWVSVPEEEIDAHVTSINQAVAKPGDLDDVEVRLTGKDEPSQNKKRKPESKDAEKRAKRKVNKNSPFYSDKIAGDAVARTQELRKVKEYLESVIEQTQAISEDEDEYLDDDLEEASSVLSENEEIDSKLDLDVNENEQLRTSIKIDINEIDGNGAIEVSEQVSSEEINKEVEKGINA